MIEDVTVIACAVAVAMKFPIAYPLAAIVIGSRQRALATLVHEASHGTLFNNATFIGKRLNQLVGRAAAFCIFQTLTAYKRSHVDAHHAHLGEHDADPEMHFYVEMDMETESGRRGIVRNLLLPTLLGLRIPQYIKYLVTNRLLPSRPSPGERHEQFWLLVTWGVVVLAAWYYHVLGILMLFWCIPYLYIFQVIGTILEICEHYPLTNIHHDDLRMSRNRLGRGIENLIFSIHNENYHLVHHLHPAIPFWNLPAAHQAMREDSEYDAITRQSGGIFTRGSLDAPSILSCLLNNTHHPNGAL